MTARASLRDRLAAARAARFVDLPVPGVEALFVRYRPVSLEVISKAAERHRKGGAERALRQHLDVLVAACEGVWEERDGKGVSPCDGFDGVIDLDTRALSGDLPSFKDEALGEAVGAADPTAWAVVTALYATDGDVAMAAAKVLEASGFAEDAEGN